MERDRFVGADAQTWWLLARDVDYRVEERRKDLGASFGWTDPTWYSDKAKLDELYSFIEVNRSVLFDELKEATDDEKRCGWLAYVVELKKPPQSAPAPSPKLSPGPAVAATAAPPRKAAFASKSQPEPASGGGGPTAGPAAASPGGAPARKSIFKAKSQPEPPAADPSLSDKEIAQVDEQIKTVMSDLSADELSAIAEDLGLSPEEVEAMVQEPDFARMVAEQQA